MFPLLALIGAGAFAVLGHFDRPALSLRRIGAVLVSITLIATGTKVVLDFAGSEVPAALAGRQSKDAYLADNLGWYYLTMQALNELGPSAHVLFLWEPRSLYCQVDCRPDALIDRWWHARRTLGSVDQIAAQWQREGVQYVLLHRAGYQAAIDLNLLRPTADDQQALDQLVENHLEFVHDYGGQYQLYRLRE